MTRSVSQLPAAQSDVEHGTRSRHTSTSSSCSQLRFTCFIAGIILIIFGVSLLVSFPSNHGENCFHCTGPKQQMSANEKTGAAMRVAGVLLIITGVIVAVVAATIISIKSVMRRNIQSLGHRAERGPSTTIANDSENNDECRGTILSLSSSLIEKLRQNWRAQEAWREEVHVHTTSAFSLPTGDDPPDYSTIEQHSKTPVPLPPAYHYHVSI